MPLIAAAGELSGQLLLWRSAWQRAAGRDLCRFRLASDSRSACQRHLPSRCCSRPCCGLKHKVQFCGAEFGNGGGDPQLGRPQFPSSARVGSNWPAPACRRARHAPRRRQFPACRDEPFKSPSTVWIGKPIPQEECRLAPISWLRSHYRQGARP